MLNFGEKQTTNRKDDKPMVRNFFTNDIKRKEKKTGQKVKKKKERRKKTTTLKMHSLATYIYFVVFFHGVLSSF
jgi:hypothetical protein